MTETDFLFNGDKNAVVLLSRVTEEGDIEREETEIKKSLLRLGGAQPEAEVIRASEDQSGHHWQSPISNIQESHKFWLD